MRESNPQTNYKTNSGLNSKKWKPWEKSKLASELIETLNQLPLGWSLTPYQEKRPFRKNWQNEPTIDRQIIKRAIASGERRTSKAGKKWTAYASGYGLRTGDVSGGLLAIDIDGVGAKSVFKNQQSAIRLLIFKCLLQSNGQTQKNLTDCWLLITAYWLLITDYWSLNTVSWTSGKEGRSQLLFQIPEKIQPLLKNFTRAVISGENGDDLEIRYNGVASALPPSYHPETGGYYWINAPWETEVAEAPQWLCDFVLNWLAKETEKNKEREAKRQQAIALRRQQRAYREFTNEIDLEDILAESIARLDVDCYDWAGHNFVERGNSLQGCCPNHASESGKSFHVNTDTLEWFCFGCNVGGHVLNYKQFVRTGNADSPTGKEFVDLVKELASDANISYQKKKLITDNCSLITLREESVPLSEGVPFRVRLPSARGLSSEKAYQEYLQWEAEEERIEAAIAYNEFLQELRDTHLLAGKITKASQPITEIHYPEDPLPTPYNVGELPLIRFKPGDRLSLIEELVRLRSGKILDSSQCGTGKSHDLGKLKNPYGGKNAIVTKEHRNPTVETIEREFHDLPTRHNGLVEDPHRATPLGNAFLRNAKAGQTPDIPSLCKHAHKFHTLQSKGYELAAEEGKTNPICANCEHFQQKITNEKGVTLPKCATKTGNGYGFMYARKMGLLPDKIRCSIDSLPMDRDYSNDYIIVDEADNLLRGTKRIEARVHDIDKTLMRIGRKFPEYFHPLRELVDRIYPYLSGDKKTPYHGLDREKIREVYKNLEQETEQLKVAEYLKVAYSSLPNITDLVAKSDRISYSQFNSTEGKYKRLANSANYKFIKDADEETTANIEALENNWLTYFLLLISGQLQGSIRIHNHKLILDIPDRTHAEKLKSTKLTYIADATASKRYLAKVLDVEENGIIQIAQEKLDLSNLTVYNVNLRGLSTNNPPKGAQRKRDRCLGTIAKRLGVKSIPLIAHKSEGKDFHLFVDTRGTNQLSGLPNLAISGKPQVNFGDAKATYYTLFGTYEGFQEHYEGITRAEISQAIGRQRVHLYPDRKFNLIYFGTNVDLNYLKESGATVIDLDGGDIDSEFATDAKQRYRKRILGVMIEFARSKTKFTQQAAAKKLGVSQGWISRCLNSGKSAWEGEWSKLLLPLLNNFDRSGNNFRESAIAAFLQGEPIEVLKEVVQVIENHGWQGLQLYLQDFSFFLQRKIIGLLLNVFLSEEEKDFVLAKNPLYNSS